eukprot:4148331-Pleurochrysis_carterae.AAC.5
MRARPHAHGHTHLHPLPHNKQQEEQGEQEEDGEEEKGGDFDVAALLKELKSAKFTLARLKSQYPAAYKVSVERFEDYVWTSYLRSPRI